VIFKLAADQNHVDGQMSRALCCLDGNDVAINEIEAAKYFKHAADQNCTRCQYYYGICLLKGQSVAINKIEAA
jgi:TPR repeat protein